METEEKVDFTFQVEFLDDEERHEEESASSQESNLDEKDLDRLVLDSKPENTRKSTKWGFSKFKSWMEKRNILVNFKTVEADELNNVLRKFYAEVKSAKNEMLTPSSMTGIRAAINRTLHLIQET